MTTTSKREYLGIQIDYDRDKLLPEQGLSMLTKSGFYKLDHEESPQESFARAATAWCFGDYELAQRIYDAASFGWFTFASPVLSNAPEIKWPYHQGTSSSQESRNEAWQRNADWLEHNFDDIQGMPISCFLSAVEDSKESLVETATETRWLSMLGGGIGLGFFNRSPDSKSTGVLAHLRGYDADTVSYRQTSTRRGSIGAYLDIEHPEILAFLDCRNPVGGDINQKAFNINNGVCIPDSFMEKVFNGEDYELIDPKHGASGRYLNAREVWEKILELRYQTGEPYIFWTDTVNRGIPKWITKPNYLVRQSNLCTEITLMTGKKRTAVCCLSSLNLEKYDEWKPTNLVRDLVCMLDNILEFFIRKAPPELSRAVHSAKQSRDIGLGTLGFHSFLQSKNIAFESGGFNSAASWNHQIYSHIKSEFVKESIKLAKERGEPDDVKGSGMRNAHGLAIAPNASSSSLVNVSPSIEPWSGNAFKAEGRAGSFLIKNKYLEKYLESIHQNTDEVWLDIIEHDGSIQHIPWIDDHTKQVFKTAYEIDQAWIIEHASERQPHICQAQSVNMFIKNGTSLQYMSDLHVLAFKKKIKTLYYCRGEAAVKADVKQSAATGKKSLNQTIDFSVCLSCEG